MSNKEQYHGNDHHADYIRRRNMGVRGNLHSFPDWRPVYDHPEGFAPLPEWKKYFPAPRRDFDRER